MIGRLRLFAPIGALALLSACHDDGGMNAEQMSSLNEEMLAQVQQRAPDPEKVMRDRWQAMFNDPAAVIAAANEFDYDAGALTATGGTPAFRTDGKTWVHPVAKAPIEVTGDFNATGADKSRLDAITFTFQVVENSEPTTKKERDALKLPKTVLGGFLSRFQLGMGDDVLRALTTGSSATSTAPGGRIVVIAQPVPGMPTDRAKKLIVTLYNTNTEPKQP